MFGYGLKCVSLRKVSRNIQFYMVEFIKLKWEYRVVGHISERDMNNLGQCGWELVNVTFYNNGTICDMIFKRPILERSEVINDAFHENG